MSCLDVRDRLAEHALGVLPPEEAATVGRHLEWCAGCRKEFGELQEGMATVAVALANGAPPPALEHRVVDRIATVSGRRTPGSHRRFRMLVAATLGLALFAAGALGWGFAERSRIETLQDTVSGSRSKIEAFAKVEKELQSRGRLLEAKLFPMPGFQGGGTAIVFSSARLDDFVLVEIVPPQPGTGPYTVRLSDQSGRLVPSGKLKRTTNGTLLLFQYFGVNLSPTGSVSILDAHHKVVLAGAMKLYSGE
jgi:putative zinc finger protein